MTSTSSPRPSAAISRSSPEDPCTASLLTEGLHRAHAMLTKIVGRIISILRISMKSKCSPAACPAGILEGLAVVLWEDRSLQAEEAQASAFAAPCLLLSAVSEGKSSSRLQDGDC